MNAQYKNSQNPKPIVEVAIVGIVLATLLYAQWVAQGCSLLDKAAWVALEVLRPVILAAGNLCWCSLQGFKVFAACPTNLHP